LYHHVTHRRDIIFEELKEIEEFIEKTQLRDYFLGSMKIKKEVLSI